MNILTAESLIVSQWDQFFGHQGLIPDAYRSGLALQFNIEITAANHGFEAGGKRHHEDWERDFYAMLELVVTARHEVFVREHAVPIGRAKTPATAWINTSNHDSCWRTDGLRPIWEVLCKAHKACWEHVPAQHRASMREMNLHCRLNDEIGGGGAIRLARVRTERVEGDHYRRALVEVQPVSFAVEIKEPATA